MNGQEVTNLLVVLDNIEEELKQIKDRLTKLEKNSESRIYKVK
jgi:phosphate starvation-inducible protein PhoH